MESCEKAFKFYLNGKVCGKSKDAEISIQSLNLNHKALCYQRKRHMDTLLLWSGASLVHWKRKRAWKCY